MKALRILKYDITEGTIKYIFRYLYIVPFVLVSCIKFDAHNLYTYYLSGERPSVIEQMFNLFRGEAAFDFHADTDYVFTFPMNWILVYICLALLIGGHIKDSTESFGLQVFVKSRTREGWWLSKCIWAILVVVSYICFIVLVIISYDWLRYGDISFERNYYIIPNSYGGQVDQMLTYRKLIMLAVVLPFLVGVVQSLIQMILSLYTNTGTALSVVLATLVLATYYPGKLIFYSYAMNIRYTKIESNAVHIPLDYEFGVWYLPMLIIFIMIIGACLIRRKDVLKNE